MRKSTIKDRYLNATVWLKGKLVMDNGNVIDNDWWLRKLGYGKLLHESRIRGLNDGNKEENSRMD